MIHILLDFITQVNISYIYINTVWIKKPINLIYIHKLYTYIASNLIGSRVYTNNLPLVLEPITHVSYIE